MVDVTVAVTCCAPEYWVTIDSTDMVDPAGNHSPQPFTPGAHYLLWWMKGSPGDTISIQLSSPGGAIGAPIAGTTPNNQSASANVVQITIPEGGS
jgi:hypothetical protein